MKQMILIITLIGQAFFGFAQDNGPVSWKISGERIAPLTYKVKVHATITEPYHIYPQSSSGGGLGMPTAIVFADDANIELVGDIIEKGIQPNKKGTSLAYYKKGVTFSQTVKLKSKKETTLSVTIKYMACNDLMCLPPSTKRLSWTIQ